VDTHAQRRLCAGTYLDREFRDRALREVYNARDKRVAPSSGFDVVPLLHHAWRAWWLETGQYLGTFAVLAIGLAIVPLDTAIAVDVLAVWWLSRLWLRWAARFVGYGEAMSSPESGQLNLPRDRRLRMDGKILKYSLWFALGALLVLIVSSVAGDRTGSPMARLAGTGLAAAVIVAFPVVVALRVVAVDICLARLRLETRPGRRLSGRMRAINRQQNYPVVVHSGHKPFVGSGKPMRSWSFVQRLLSSTDRMANGRGREFDRPPFPARKLVDRLKASILGLCDDEDPETRLPGLSVTDRVFVHGAHAVPLSYVMATDAGSNDMNKVIDDAIASPGDAARHYLAASVVSWGGDVVTSVFVHVSLQGRTLYLEFATYVLFPVKTEYVVPRTTPRTLVSAADRELAASPDAGHVSARIRQF
jgi:hypothetical protein